MPLTPSLTRSLTRQLNVSKIREAGGDSGGWPEVSAFSQVGSAEFAEVGCRGVRLSDDGVKILVFSDSEIKESVVYSTAYSPTDTATPTNVLTGDYDDGAWSAAGDKLFTVDGTVYEERANGGVAFKPTTGELATLTDSFTPTGGPDSCEISPDGTKLWHVAGATTLYEVTMSTPWDLTTAANGNTLTGIATASRCMRMAPNGLKMYIQSVHVLSEWVLSVAYDITSATDTGREIADISVGSAGGGIYGFDVSPDGSVLLAQSQWGNDTAKNDTIIWTS